MKRTILLFLILICQVSYSQNNIDQLLELGTDNAQRFTKDYFAPAGEVLINGMSNGWYSTAKVKKLWSFEVGFVGNLSFIREEKQSFVLRASEYNNLTILNPNSGGGNLAELQTANVLGGNQGVISVVLNEGLSSEVQVDLPTGVADKATSMIPTGFIQASMGISRSTEVKARFLPRLKVRNNTEVFLYGVALQHEFTDWVFSMKRFPFRISGLIGYTKVNGYYNFTNSNGQDIQEQEIKLKTNSWVVSGIISTKLPKLNFYGGFGCYFGASNANLLGTYTVQNGPLASQTLQDPISVKNNSKGFKATIGTSVKLGFFRANLDYSLQNYNNLSLGLNFGW